MRLQVEMKNEVLRMQQRNLVSMEVVILHALTEYLQPLLSLCFYLVD